MLTLGINKNCKKNCKNYVYCAYDANGNKLAERENYFELIFFLENAGKNQKFEIKKKGSN